MLTRIVHNSPKLCTFFDQLNTDLSKPQRQHILNLADALLVCEDTKTLAALQRQFLEAPDASNMADFLRISPWCAEDARVRLRANQVAWAIAQAELTGTSKVIFINIDDALGKKDKNTCHLEPVDWFHDHNESTKNRPCYKKAFCYLECTLRIGRIVVTVDLRLYLRAKTVRRLNRYRPPDQRIPFRSKNSLAQSMLEALRPLLPQGWTVYVQFDSWYASEQLIKYVRRQGWHVMCGLKCNRQLNGKRLDQLAYAFRHRRYTQVQVTAADGNKTTYYVRQTIGRLVKVPYDVRVFFSKRHPREKSQAYFMSTDLTRSAQQALQGYSGRWSCEVVNFYLKTQLGLADFRVQSYETVDKYIVVVLLTWAYIERRFEEERSAQIKNYGDVIRQHRDEHAMDWLTSALEMMRETNDVQQVLQRFLRLETQPA
jgi:hypothetical protein